MSEELFHEQRVAVLLFTIYFIVVVALSLGVGYLVLAAFRRGRATSTSRWYFTRYGFRRVRLGRWYIDLETKEIIRPVILGRRIGARGINRAYHEYSAEAWVQRVHLITDQLAERVAGSESGPPVVE